MENFGKKMGLCVVWLGRGKRKLIGEAQAFSTRAHAKLFSPKWREKRDENA